LSLATPEIGARAFDKYSLLIPLCEEISLIGKTLG